MHGEVVGAGDVAVGAILVRLTKNRLRLGDGNNHQVQGDGRLSSLPKSIDLLVVLRKQERALVARAVELAALVIGAHLVDVVRHAGLHDHGGSLLEVVVVEQLTSGDFAGCSLGGGKGVDEQVSDDGRRFA